PTPGQKKFFDTPPLLARLLLRCSTSDLDVEMMGCFLRPQGFVERYRRPILEVRLNENDVGAECRSDPLQLADHSGRDAAAAVLLEDGEIVDVDFAPFLLEFLQHVGDRKSVV